MISLRNDVPVVVVNCKLGGLAIMRSLGELGVRIHGIDSDPDAAGLQSRYCRTRSFASLELRDSGELLAELDRVSANLGTKAVLIPTSDDTALFVAQNREHLARRFMFQDNGAQLVSDLISKQGMARLANESGVPVPGTLFPGSEADVRAYIEGAGQFPVMLKAIDGVRLAKRTGVKMVIVRSADELLERFRELDEPGFPNLMLQEYIPGGDDQIYIFNGYFDAQSECLAAFTGHKIRQFPVHVGCASLGVCRTNADVAHLTMRFMKVIGYRGVLDIGYRFDARDGKYKVLDINPRVGQAFRLFVDKDGLDSVRALYLDLTGQSVPACVPREERKWLIEDMDIVSSYHYYREGSLSLGDWLRSFEGVEEAMWFRWRDPWPFLQMAGRLLRQAAFWMVKRLRRMFGLRADATA
jgi:D-aspartate ligase